MGNVNCPVATQRGRTACSLRSRDALRDGHSSARSLVVPDLELLTFDSSKSERRVPNLEPLKLLTQE